MTQKEKAHALYLANPDTGRVELIHADDVEAKKAAGYEQPDGQKANGTAWNHEDDLAQQDIAADFAKSKSQADGKKAADQAKEDEAAQKARDKAREAEAEKPDMKVQAVTPKKR